MGLIGRNDPCICGSGMKYKKCCLGKGTQGMFRKWKENAFIILEDTPEKEQIINSFFKMLEIIEIENWDGACHSVSSVLFLILREIGLEPSLYVGEVAYGGFEFSHSWVEINNKIYDIAIYKGLDNVSLHPPVFDGLNISNLQKTECIYGIKELDALDAFASPILNIGIVEYMNNFPKRKDGLWYYVREVSAAINLTVDIDELKKKYSETKWTFKNIEEK